MFDTKVRIFVFVHLKKLTLDLQQDILKCAFFIYPVIKYFGKMANQHQIMGKKFFIDNKCLTINFSPK